MANKIEKELVAATGVERAEGQEDTDYKKALAAAANKLAEDEWGSLSDNTQNWVNVTNFCGETNAESDIPAFDDADALKKMLATMEAHDEEAEADAPVEKKTKKKAKKAKSEAPSEKKTRRAKKGNGASASSGKRGRKGSFEPTAKVTKVVGECPFRKDSKAAKCFSQYKVGRTVAQILKAGVPRAKLYRHMKRGIVTIAA